MSEDAVLEERPGQKRRKRDTRSGQRKIFVRQCDFRLYPVVSVKASNSLLFFLTVFAWRYWGITRLQECAQGSAGSIRFSRLPPLALSCVRCSSEMTENPLSASAEIWLFKRIIETTNLFGEGKLCRNGLVENLILICRECDSRRAQGQIPGSGNAGSSRTS
jgi:hypothetical protein